jgi:hypothetical protein
MSLRSPNDKKFMSHTNDDTIKVAALNDKLLDLKLKAGNIGYKLKEKALDLKLKVGNIKHKLSKD